RRGRFEARWSPVLDAAERRRLATLVPALPPALLAAADEDRRPAGAVLREVREQLVGAACRAARVGRRPTPARGGRGVEAAWLGALTAADRVVAHADSGELQLLAKELEAWHRSGQRSAPLRAAFRLQPPAAPTVSDHDPAVARESDGELPGWR